MTSVFHHFNTIYSTLGSSTKNYITIGDIMKQSNLQSMSIDELWRLHEKTCAILATRLDAEKHELERRLAQLNASNKHHERARRPYPKVHPKYRNPERPSETWSGRGRQPRWVGAQLRKGKKVDDLLISRYTEERNRSTSKFVSYPEASSSLVARSWFLPFELHREAFAKRDSASR